MRRRWGLRAKMAASYVLTTAVAVIVVEAVGLGIVVPGIVASKDSLAAVDATAITYAGRATQLSAALGRLPTGAEFPLGEPEPVDPRPGSAQFGADGRTLRIPYLTDPVAGPVTMALLIDADGQIAASSYPGRYKVGDSADAALPQRVLNLYRHGGLPKGKLISGDAAAASDGKVNWSVALVFGGGGPKSGKNLDFSPLGLVYVQVPASAAPNLPVGETDAAAQWRAVGQQVGVGLLVLIAAIPVGIVFGLLSTRRLIGRLRRLAASTVAVAEGDYHHRVPVSGNDEVTRLEGNFNRMAERLAATMSAERELASAGERARIARELHDSISQDLFSLRMLAGGMRKALPPGSPLLAQVSTMEQTATETMDEMQALLLELRPLALGEAGLVAALDELSRAYRDRLGVAVDARLAPVRLGPAAEHAVLRVVQEALANAVKHARPNRIALDLREDGGQVVATVRDDGTGFAPDEVAGHGMGLRLMRERATELGGALRVESRPGGGTTVEMMLPVPGGTA